MAVNTELWRDAFEQFGRPRDELERAMIHVQLFVIEADGFWVHGKEIKSKRKIKIEIKIRESVWSDAHVVDVNARLWRKPKKTG